MAGLIRAPTRTCLGLPFGPDIRFRACNSAEPTPRSG
jgi:hypothetical protein